MRREPGAACHALRVIGGDAAPVFVLIHSPPGGPSTSRPVARELEGRGRQVLVRRFSAPPRRSYHSGGIASMPSGPQRASCQTRSSSSAQRRGLLLPAIASQHGGLAADLCRLRRTGEYRRNTAGTAGLPRPSAHARGNGRLPPWSTWWGNEAMRDLVPDEAARAALEPELPSLPLSYFEQSVPSPAGWDRMRCAYLLLSDAYRDAASDARERGLRVEEIVGAQHLHMVVAPATVTDVLIRLAEMWRHRSRNFNSLGHGRLRVRLP